ncbi:hypothetical protein F9C11_27870 [Amycolatopsis sp. VS8301801F10]
MTNMRQREMRGHYPAAVRAVQGSPLCQRQACRKGARSNGIRSLT